MFDMRENVIGTVSTIAARANAKKMIAFSRPDRNKLKDVILLLNISLKYGSLL